MYKTCASAQCVQRGYRSVSKVYRKTCRQHMECMQSEGKGDSEMDCEYQNSRVSVCEKERLLYLIDLRLTSSSHWLQMRIVLVTSVMH